MQNKKVLLVSEATYLNSGYSNYGYQIMKMLYDTKDFDLAEISCHGNHDRSHEIPWKSYVVPENSNIFGKDIFNDVLIDFKPDIVWSFRDPWVDDFICDSVLRNHFKWVYMPTIDSLPLDIDWIDTINRSDAVLTYTDWAAEELKNLCPNMNIFGSASPGFDFNFIPVEDKIKFKIKHGINGDALIIGSVMRNQKRKLIPDLFDAFCELIEKADSYLSERLFLYLHTTYPDVGWNIPRLLSERPKISNKVLFSYNCSVCSKLSISSFSGAILQCNNCKNISCTFPRVTKGSKRDDMSMVYNLMDLYVQYSCAEGFGMPIVEAASCGVPICAVDYSAMKDIVKKLEGFPIKVQRYTYEVETNRKFALPDNSDFVNTCIEFFKKPIPIRNILSKKTRKLVEHNFNYKNTFEKIKNLFSLLPFSESWKKEAKYIKVPDILNKDISNEEFIQNIFDKIPIDFGNLKEKCLFKLNYKFYSKEKIYEELKTVFNNYNYYESLRENA